MSDGESYVAVACTVFAVCIALAWLRFVVSIVTHKDDS